MIEERQGRADGEAVQPERDLGQFHRHTVEIDAVDAAFEHHAADDVAILKLVLYNGPAMVARIGEDGFSQSGDVLHQRRRIAIARNLFGIANRGKHFV